MTFKNRSEELHQAISSLNNASNAEIEARLGELDEALNQLKQLAEQGDTLQSRICENRGFEVEHLRRRTRAPKPKAAAKRKASGPAAP